MHVLSKYYDVRIVDCKLNVASLKELAKSFHGPSKVTLRKFIVSYFPPAYFSTLYFIICKTIAWLLHACTIFNKDIVQKTSFLRYQV